jgi:beta-lactamase superfamily II metal-dependent hydrolase
MFEIEMLPAECGDCLFVRWGKGKQPFQMLIDGGLGSSQALKRRLVKRQKTLELELLVVTHIDNDHILGVRKLLQENPEVVAPKRVWFNAREQLKPFLKGDRMSTAEGDRLMQLLARPRFTAAWNPEALVADPSKPLPKFTLGPSDDALTITLLSPDAARLTALAKMWLKTKLAKLAEDRMGAKLQRKRVDKFTLEQLAREPFKADGSVPNGSSIAFIAEYDGKRLLCGADAWAPVLEKALDRYAKDNGIHGPIALASFKLPHHGSEANLSNSLLQSIACESFLFSTDGSQFEHPDDVAVARAIKASSKPTLWFNYKSPRNQHWATPALQSQAKFAPKYPKTNDSGIVVPLG